MRAIVWIMCVGLLLGSTAASGQQNRHAPKKHDALDPDRGVVQGGVRVVFSTQDVEVIREHYVPQYRDLPPGLRKKLARTGTLPPGWQKKLAPFPVRLERPLGALPDDFRRGVIDGQIVIYNRHTQVIVDVAVLF